MINAMWRSPEKDGLQAHVTMNGRRGVGRLFLDDKLVFETRGNRDGVGDEWDDERPGVIDLAVILHSEAYERGELDFARYIAGGFNTALVTTEAPSEWEKWGELLSETRDDGPRVDETGQGFLF